MAGTATRRPHTTSETDRVNRLRARSLPTFLGVAVLLAVGFIGSTAGGVLRAAAATLTVTTASDSGPGSLRAAVATAVSGDTITFASSLNRTPIALHGGEIVVTASIDIVGNGMANTILDGAGSRIWNITGGATVAISAMSMRNGRASDDLGGGAILVQQGANVTVTESMMSGNSAVQKGGAARTFGGSLALVDSTVADNSAPLGGGIFNTSSLTITGSTLSGNNAHASPGAGGGIYNACCFSMLTIANSTLFGNTGGGIFNDPFNFLTTVTSSTIAGNLDGGITNNNRMRITDSIVANNMGGNCGPVLPEDGGHNLSFPATDTCGFSGGGQDPMLGPLQPNGGPTETMALQTGSPAIDAGGTCPAGDNGIDQRGFHRDTPCDIGAFEVQVPVHTGLLLCMTAPAVTVIPDARGGGIYDWFIHGPGGLYTPGNGRCLGVTGQGTFGVLMQGSGTSTGLGVCSPTQPYVGNLALPIVLTLTRSGGAPIVLIEHFRAVVTSYPLVTPFQVFDDAGSLIGLGTMQTHILLRCPPRGVDNGDVQWIQM
jgi:hypothetical protein